MQISRALMRNKVATLLFRRRLFIVLIAFLLLIVVILVVVQGSPENPIAVSGDTESGSGSGDPLIVTPEYGFTGGGIVALVICFAAFALFAKRGKTLGNKGSF
jgi:hypothetical protein